jgi:flagellar biosynthetic protein FliQ
MMDTDSVELVREALIIVLKISAPVLIAGVVTGLVISIIQSVTSIQDQTLSFVPKIVVMLVVAIMLIPWVVQRLMDYASLLFSMRV